jgi:hypothetical protein
VHAVDIPLCVGPQAPVYARRGAYLFELAVGKGKLLVSGFNFSPEMLQKIEVRALYDALVRYANGAEFKPATQAEPAAFREYVTSVKPDPRLSPEGHWDTVFYTDRDVAGRDMFMDNGEAQPFVPLPALGR